jgi:hypothetical protein
MGTCTAQVVISTELRELVEHSAVAAGDLPSQS